MAKIRGELIRSVVEHVMSESYTERSAHTKWLAHQVAERLGETNRRAIEAHVRRICAAHDRIENVSCTESRAAWRWLDDAAIAERDTQRRQRAGEKALADRLREAHPGVLASRDVWGEPGESQVLVNLAALAEALGVETPQD